MFQLIVAVISIALVAALAIASIYYGGAAFTSSSLRANVTTMVNGGQQISGAVALFKTDNGGSAPRIEGAGPTGEAGANDLTPDYLGSMPGVAPFIGSVGWSLNDDATVALAPFKQGSGFGAAITVDRDEICKETNRQATGDDVSTAGTGQFFCSDFSGAPVAAGSATHFAFRL